MSLERERSNMLKGLRGVLVNLQCLLRYPYTNSHRDSFFASVEEEELRKAASRDTWGEGTANNSNSKVLLSQINDAISLLQPLQEVALQLDQHGGRNQRQQTGGYCSGPPRNFPRNLRQ